MRKPLPLAIMAGTILGLAGCNSKPPEPPPPRVPRILYAAYEKNPGLGAKYSPVCQSIEHGTSLTREELNNCRLLDANMNLYITNQRLKADAKKWRGF